VTCGKNGLETIHDKCVEISLMAIYLEAHCIEYRQGLDFNKCWNWYNCELLAP